MEYHLGHVAYGTLNLERTVAFYVNVFGFRRAFDMHDRQDRPWIVYLLTPDGQYIEFFRPKPESGNQSGGLYKHLCLEVDDITAAMKEMEAKGVEIMEQIKQAGDGNYQAWVRDPDGREIELMQLVESSAQYQFRKGMK